MTTLEKLIKWGEAPTLDRIEITERTIKELNNALKPFPNLREPDFIEVRERALELVSICDDALRAFHTLRNKHGIDANRAKKIGADARAAEKRLLRLREDQEARARMAANATHCDESGCNKPRSFYDDTGNGYCKRHADAKGIRPRGKIQ